MAAQTEYLDVFMSGGYDTTLQIVLMVIFSLSAVAIIALIIFDFENVFAKVVIGLAVVGVLGSTIGLFADYQRHVNVTNQVASNMKQNVMAKYGKELQMDYSQLPKVEDRDKPNVYWLILRSDQSASNYTMSEYMISFDRKTNEPTISEVPPVKVPTAAELEESAKK